MDGVAFPLHTPIVTLDTIGERRPPGTMVIGWSALALSGNGEGVRVLDDYDKELDKERVSRWLGGNYVVGWKVQLEEGLDKRWENSEGMNEINRKACNG